MAGILEFILGNFTLTFLVIGLMASGISLFRGPKPLTRKVVIESTVLLLPVVLYRL
jgi:type IV secretory pathway VirB2 component (pilin)